MVHQRAHKKGIELGYAILVQPPVVNNFITHITRLAKKFLALC